MGFICNIINLKNISNKLFNNYNFETIKTHKFSQDSLESFFSCVRKSNGNNVNPDSLQLKFSIRKLLMQNYVEASQFSNTSSDNIQSSSSSSLIELKWHGNKSKNPVKDTTPIADDIVQDVLNEHLSEDQIQILKFLSGNKFFRFYIYRIVKIPGRE